MGKHAFSHELLHFFGMHAAAAAASSRTCFIGEGCMRCRQHPVSCARECASRSSEHKHCEREAVVRITTKREWPPAISGTRVQWQLSRRRTFHVAVAPFDRFARRHCEPGLSCRSACLRLVSVCAPRIPHLPV